MGGNNFPIVSVAGALPVSISAHNTQQRRTHFAIPATTNNTQQRRGLFWELLVLGKHQQQRKDLVLLSS